MQVDREIRRHHKWLVDLHRLLPTHAEHEDATTSCATKCPDQVTSEQCQARFPQWMWGLRPSLFTWKPKILANMLEVLYKH